MGKSSRRTTGSSHRRGPAGVFVTGTDTDVGKTVVTAALALCLTRRGLSVGAMKPVETGYCDTDPDRSDAARLLAAAGMEEPLEAMCPYRFPDPVAPIDAARRAGSAIRLSNIIASFRMLSARHAVMLVEGAGGVLVPVSKHADMTELIERTGLPAIVVGRAALGGVNHVRLTVEALISRRIAVAAVVLNRTSDAASATLEEMQETSTLALLKSWSPVPVIGPLPYEPLFGQSWERGLAAVAASPAISDLADLVSETARQRRVSRPSRRRPARSRKRPRRRRRPLR